MQYKQTTSTLEVFKLCALKQNQIHLIIVLMSSSYSTVF